jgi:hypothetical protein
MELIQCNENIIVIHNADFQSKLQPKLYTYCYRLLYYRSSHPDVIIVATVHRSVVPYGVSKWQDLLFRHITHNAK